MIALVLKATVAKTGHDLDQAYIDHSTDFEPCSSCFTDSNIRQAQCLYAHNMIKITVGY